MAKLSSFTTAANLVGALLPILQGGTNKNLSISSLFLTGSAVIDFASVADNAVSATSNVSVTGAVAGDFVIGLSASGSIDTTNGVSLYGSVITTGVVGVYLINDSGGAFDAASQTIRVLVIPKAVLGL